MSTHPAPESTARTGSRHIRGIAARVLLFPGEIKKKLSCVCAADGIPETAASFADVLLPQLGVGRLELTHQLLTLLEIEVNDFDAMRLHEALRSGERP